MQPQTDAELIAYNYGADIASAPSAYRDVVSDQGAAMLYPISTDARRACETLGHELFWQWADRGYAITLQQQHQQP